MDKRVRKQFHVVPTFDEVEQEYNGEEFKDPGPGLARQATEFVLSPFYTREYDNTMQQTAQGEALAGILQPIPHKVGAAGPQGPRGPPGPPGPHGATGTSGRVRVSGTSGRARPR